MKSQVRSNNIKVYIYASKIGFPIFFGTHSWFVIKDNKTTSRWEILSLKNKSTKSWDHLHKNFLPPNRGLGLFRQQQPPYRKATRLATISGKNAKEIKQIIEDSPNKYPYNSKYLLLGPNSNSYTSWVLMKFSNSYRNKLPRSAVGKDYWNN